MLDDQALLDTDIGFLDLLTTSLRVGATQSKFNFSTGVLGKSFGIDLTMGKASKLALGPAGKSSVTGQYCTQARVDNTELGINVSTNFLSFLNALFSLDFRVALVVAPAVARPNYIEVAPGTTTVDLGVNTGVATMRITNTAGDGPAALKILGVRVVSIGTNTNDILLSFTNVPIKVPNPVQDNLPYYSNASGQISGSLENLFNIGNIKFGLFNEAVSFDFGPLLQPITSLLSSILKVVVDPFFRILGLNVGSADVRVFGLQARQPQLAQ
ncbi:MAG: hypothetical protein QM742_10930 [Aquabacterium sp.]